MFKVLERLLQDKIATEDITFSGSERFRGKIQGRCPEGALEASAKACPVGAFSPSGIDYRR